MTYSRWRRRGLTGFGDIADLVTALGGDSVVPAFYDFRTNVTSSGGVVDSWADARGAGGGPALTGTAAGRPSFSAAGIVFDGTDDFLRNSATGRLSDLSGSFGFVLVGTAPATAGAALTVAYLSAGAVTRTAQHYRGSANGAAFFITSAQQGTVAVRASTRVFHGRRTGAGIGGTTGLQDGSLVENTIAETVAHTTPDRLTLGANNADSPASFSPATLRAVILFAGDYAGKQATVNTWATANHGATL